MQKKLYKELWNLRFQKMLALEEQSIQDYEKILSECTKQNIQGTVKGRLKQVISDEMTHAKLVNELIQIVNCQGE